MRENDQLFVTPLALEPHVKYMRGLLAGEHSKITQVLAYYDATPKQWLPVSDLVRVLSELDFWVLGASDLEEQQELQGLRDGLRAMIEAEVDTHLPLDLSSVLGRDLELLLSVNATMIKAEHQLRAQGFATYKIQKGDGLGAILASLGEYSLVLEFKYVITTIRLMGYPTNEVIWHRENPRVYSGMWQKPNSLSRTT